MSLKILFVGDILLSNPYLESLENGVILDSDLDQVDRIIGNLEGPVSSTRDPISKTKCCVYSEKKGLEILEKSGFTDFTLANNHIMDDGSQGLAETIKYLDDHGLGHVGAGMDISSALNPLIISQNGKKIAILAFTWDFIQSTIATKDRAGAAPIQEEVIHAYLDRVLRKNQVDHIFIALHWGYESERYPIPYQRDLARSLIDRGASAVLGHHPHIVQGIEEYRGRIIAYSMGNFIFPDIKVGKWKIKQKKQNKIGIGVLFAVDKDKLTWKVKHVTIDENFVPRISHSVKLASTLERYSRPLSLSPADYKRFYPEFRVRKTVPLMTGNRYFDYFKAMFYGNTRFKKIYLRSLKVKTKIKRIIN